MDPFAQEILELIASHDGQHSWYQLDRSLSQFSTNRERNTPLLRGLTRVLRKLVEEGLISAGEGHHPSQSVYSITANGRQSIAASATEPLLRKQG